MTEREKGRLNSKNIGKLPKTSIKLAQKICAHLIKVGAKTPNMSVHLVVNVGEMPVNVSKLLIENILHLISKASHLTLDI